MSHYENLVDHHFTQPCAETCTPVCELNQDPQLEALLDAAVGSVLNHLNVCRAKHSYTQSERLDALRKAADALNVALKGFESESVDCDVE